MSEWKLILQHIVIYLWFIVFCVIVTCEVIFVMINLIIYMPKWRLILEFIVKYLAFGLVVGICSIVLYALVFVVVICVTHLYALYRDKYKKNTKSKWAPLLETWQFAVISFIFNLCCSIVLVYVLFLS